MIRASLSGDIISSTSLNNQGRDLLEKSLQDLIKKLNDKFDIYGRVIKGDYVECVVPQPKNALRVALIIKSYVKAIDIKESIHYEKNKRIKSFKTHGIRIAIGYGDLSRYDPEHGIIDGEAIYLSGRKISELSSYNKQRIVIKNTLFFESKNETLNCTFEPLFNLIDVLLSKATARQCEVLSLKLFGDNEDTIAKKLNIKQAVVNTHSTGLGWNAIEKSIEYFENIINPI